MKHRKSRSHIVWSTLKAWTAVPRLHSMVCGLHPSLLSYLAAAGTAAASQQALAVSGSVMEARDGLLVRRFRDGSIEVLGQIPRISREGFSLQ